jgi:hypothetical protein
MSRRFEGPIARGEQMQGSEPGFLHEDYNWSHKLILGNKSQPRVSKQLRDRGFSET